jgi:hypothetical protein
MTYAVSQGRAIGIPDLNAVYTTLGVPGVGNLPSVTTEAQPGEIVTAWDKSLGSGEFILLEVPTSTTVTPGLLYTWKGDYSIAVVATSVASAAASGLPIALAINTVSSNASSVQWTWFQIQGKGTVLTSLTGTVRKQPNVPLFVSNVTAGRVRTTASIFRTIIGIRSANTVTVASTVSTLAVYLNRPSIGPGA